MRKKGERGFSLIQLLLILVMISVVSTAFWNFHVNRLEASFGSYQGGKAENSAKMALEDIKYHIGLAGYDVDNGKKPLEITEGEEGDRIIIWHNNVCFEFFVDKGSNLIKKVESSEKIMAENIKSLDTARVGGNKIAVTLSTIPLQENRENKIETLSKSYSSVIEMKSLL